MSSIFWSSAFWRASSLFFFAISRSALILASFACLSASALATAISFSASALAMAAFFLIWEILSIPRSSITPFPSAKFCTLKLTMSRPMAARSGSAFSFTRFANFWRSLTISSSLMRPTISRILPSRTSLAMLAMYCVFWFKKFSAASANLFFSLLILIFTAASTWILI